MPSIEPDFSYESSARTRPEKPDPTSISDALDIMDISTRIVTDIFGREAIDAMHRPLERALKSTNAKQYFFLGLLELAFAFERHEKV